MSSSALYGFVGVAAGAVTTGGVQYFAEWRKRRSDSLVAGRLIYGALVEVEKAVKSAVTAGRFPSNTSFAQQVELWETHRVSLAHRLSVFKFNTIQGAFSSVRDFDSVVQAEREKQTADLGVARIRADPGYDLRITTINEAQLIALKASSRIRDRLTQRWHVRRHKQRLEAA